VTSVRAPLARLTPIALALLPLACNTGFAPQYRVTDLRVLTVRSQVLGSAAADADVGDTVRLTALVANPLGRAGLLLKWRACIPTTSQALPPCLDPQWLATPARFDTPEAAARGVFPLDQVPGASQAPDGSWIEVPLTDPSVTAAVQAVFDQAIQFALDNPPYQCTLYVELPVVIIAQADGAQQVSVKRVRLAPVREVADDGSLPPGFDKYTLNFNPGITGIYVDPTSLDDCLGGPPLAVTCDQAITCDTGATCTPDPQGGLSYCTPTDATLDANAHVLCGRVDARFDQQYGQCAPGAATSTPPLMLDERTSWQWYTTGGSLSDADGVGNVTSAHPKLTRPPGAFTLWLLLRDGRGGENWLRRDFDALP